MNHAKPTSDPCAICGRAVRTHYDHVGSDELNEPYNYNICRRSDCELLGSDIKTFLAEDPYNDLTFDKVLHEVQRHRSARLPDTKTKIGDYSGASQ